MRQKVAAAEQKIADARAQADRRVAYAQNEASHAHESAKKCKKDMIAVLRRLHVMGLLGDQQLNEATRWVDDVSGHIVIRPDEESLFTMFTQQHYTALAQVIRETRQHITADGVDIPKNGGNLMKRGVDELQLRLMKMLAKDNPKFKELLFIAAASEHDK